MGGESHGVSDAEVVQGRSGRSPERLEEWLRRVGRRQGRSLLRSSSGRRTVSAGSGVIPGVYYQQSVGGSRSGRGQAPAQVPAKAPKPGLFAPKGEKELYNAIRAQSVSAIRAVGDVHSDFRIASYSLAGLMLLDDDSAQAKSLLTPVFDQGGAPEVDPFVVKYIAATRMELPIAAGVSAQLSLSRDAVGLSLAELCRKRATCRARSTSSSGLSRAPRPPSRSQSCTCSPIALTRSSS